VTITVYSDVPNAPSGLSASVSGSTVTLRWTDNASNEDGFYIERAVKTKKPVFGRIGQVATGVIMFQNTGVPRGTYVYSVQAFRGAKTSAYSNQVQARVR
jgi:titin